MNNNVGWLYACGLCCGWPIICIVIWERIVKRIDLTNIHFRNPWSKE